MEKWKSISSVNKLNVWKKLEDGWEEFAGENKFECISYTCAKIPSNNVNTKTTVCDNQEICLQANRVSLDGEGHFESDKPWKKKRPLSGSSEDGSEDEESEDRCTSNKARRSGRMTLLSRDSTASLIKSSTAVIIPLKKKNDEINEHSPNSYEEYPSVGVQYRCVCVNVCVFWMSVGMHACGNACVWECMQVKTHL